MIVVAEMMVGLVLCQGGGWQVWFMVTVLFVSGSMSGETVLALCEVVVVSASCSDGNTDTTCV